MRPIIVFTLVLVALASGGSYAAAPAAPPSPVGSPASAQATAEKDAKPPPKKPAIDRLDLERTEISGNRELPKVMVILPWKRADVGEWAGRPASSLMDDVLKPLDREVLRRELGYYEALGRGASTHPPTSGSASSKGEK